MSWTSFVELERRWISEIFRSYYGKSSLINANIFSSKTFLLIVNGSDSIYLFIFQNKYPDENKALKLDIRFHKEVISIEWERPTAKKSVIIKCKDNSTYEADHVIVAVPLGVLKNR